MNRKLFSRVVAIFLAIIMVVSVVAVAFPVFGMSPDMVMIANTGDTSNNNMMIVIGAVALVVVLALVVLPMITKNKK